MDMESLTGAKSLFTVEHRETKKDKKLQWITIDFQTVFTKLQIYIYCSFINSSVDIYLKHTHYINLQFS